VFASRPHPPTPWLLFGGHPTFFLAGARRTLESECRSRPYASAPGPPLRRAALRAAVPSRAVFSSWCLRQSGWQLDRSLDPPRKRGWIWSTATALAPQTRQLGSSLNTCALILLQPDGIEDLFAPAHFLGVCAGQRGPLVWGMPHTRQGRGIIRPTQAGGSTTPSPTLRSSLQLRPTRSGHRVRCCPR
jgi:hypothetical protein